MTRFTIKNIEIEMVERINSISTYFVKNLYEWWNKYC